MRKAAERIGHQGTAREGAAEDRMPLFAREVMPALEVISPRTSKLLPQWESVVYNHG